MCRRHERGLRRGGIDGARGTHREEGGKKRVACCVKGARSPARYTLTRMPRRQCIACSNDFPLDEVRYPCDCGTLLSVERDTPLPERSLFDSRRATPRTPADQ